MNLMEKLHRAVIDSLSHDARVSLSRPKNSDGLWILRIIKPSGYSVEVEWRPFVRGFGIVAGFELEFGTGVHEILGSIQGAVRRIADLYGSESATDPAGPMTLKELRILRGTTQNQLASLLAVTNGLIAQRESGAVGTMQVDTVRQIVEALGGTLDLVVKLPEEQPRCLKLT
jgi:hypothetical protein